MQMVAQIHRLLCAVINLSRLSDGQLTLSMLQNIAKFFKYAAKHVALRISDGLFIGSLRRFTHVLGVS